MNCILMFYNVENLFYPTKSPIKNWTKERYNRKLTQIAKVFRLVEKKYGSFPLCIGICEVQEKECIRDLLATSNLSNYDFVYSESKDDRGMDTAFLYNKNEIELLSYQNFSVESTRNILYCKIKLRNHILHTYTLHLPSKRNFDENKNLRKDILEKLKKIIQDNVSNSEEFVVILGDFNANPNDEDLVKLMQIRDNYTLFNPFFDLYGKPVFSTFHLNRGLLFDQFIISKNFSEHHSLKWKNADIFTSEEIKKQGKPFRTFAGTRYLGGYSDHFPAILELEITN